MTEFFKTSLSLFSRIHTSGFRKSSRRRSNTVGPKFVAIDFETANYEPNSACAVGLVRVENGQIVRRKHFYIRPPSRDFVFTYLHGISWHDVKDKPDFAGIWPHLQEELTGIEFLAAHNADFDRGVLYACCASSALRPPDLPFICTVQLARSAWGIYPTKLPNVCRHLGLELNHHEALSDAEACARIVIEAHRIRPPKRLSTPNRRGEAPALPENLI